MLTRRSALFGAAAVAAAVSATPTLALDESDDPTGGTVADPRALAKLPRVKPKRPALK